MKIDPYMANSFGSGSATSNSEDALLLARRERVLGSSYRLFYQQPVNFVRGDGVLLFDSDNNSYLDAYNNVPVVGHSNPLVQSRVSKQLSQINTHTRYLSNHVVDYAERLTGLFAEMATQAVFVCTGSEAVDLALRIARQVTGRRGVIATNHAYHGTTAASVAVSPSLGPKNEIPEDIELVRAPDLATEDADQAANNFAKRVKVAAAQLTARGYEPAALIVDSVLSSDGLQSTVANVLGPAAKVVQDLGGLYIADEVQSGFGRTGKWWGYQSQSLTPDLVVLGKPMGNGLPIAAVLGSPEILESFGQDIRYFNTFGGNPVCIAAADAVLDEICQRKLLSQATEVGKEALEALQDLQRCHPGIADARGTGLFLALELCSTSGTPAPDRAAAIVNHMRNNRVLISLSGPDANVLKIRPPLVFESTHLPRLLDALSEAISCTSEMIDG